MVLSPGFSVGSRPSDTVNISGLLFADDTLVFCGVNYDNICSLKLLLICFEAVSGLKVNVVNQCWFLWAMWIMLLSWLVY
jgi:hypothetical protein